MRVGLATVPLVVSGCLEYSPHQLPDDPSERDLNARAIERILAQPRGPLRFAVVGDTQRSFDEAEDFVAHVNARDDVRFVVQVGDFTNVGLLPEYRLMNDIFARLRVPYVVVIGNHDHFSNGEAIYREMFGPEDFAFTLESVRLVFFCSSSSSHPGEAIPDAEEIAAMLAPSPGHDRALAFAHIAPFGAVELGATFEKPLRDALAGAGVAASFSGHAHVFQDFHSDGVRYVVADDVGGRNYLLVSERTDGGFEVERVFF